MLTIGSLFSGIGGLELGLEWAGFGPTLWQVEKDANCRAVLARHWPGVTQYDDVRAVGAGQLVPVDLICGGFPCQDVSSAGKRVGLSGARSGLWYEFARIVGECRPRFVVVENVASGAHLWLDAVRGALGELGYASLPIPLAAMDVGAPHARRRIFIVAASADAKRERVRNEHGRSCGASGTAASEPADDGAPRYVADAEGERRAPRSLSERDETELARPAGDGTHVPNPDVCREHAQSEHAEVAATSRDVGDSLQFGRSRPQGRGHERRPESPTGGWWSSEPAVGRVVDGVPGGLVGRARRGQVRALGNAVVPQCAEVVGHVIRRMIGASEMQR